MSRRKSYKGNKGKKTTMYIFIAIIIALVIFLALNYTPFNKVLAGQKSPIDIMKNEIEKNDYSFEVGENSVTKKSIKELTGLDTSKAPKQSFEMMSFDEEIISSKLPSKYDLRDLGYVTPVKDQGTVGTCWAFATTSTLEVAIAKKDNIIVDLSEQFLMAINKEGYGTQGGWFAHHYHIDPGAVLEEDFPYQAKDGVPWNNPDYNHKYKADSWGYVQNSFSVPNVNKLKSAIYEYGSLSVAVAADMFFQYYKGGVFDRHNRGGVNHAVNLIGWDDEKGAWIMENSWGEYWGDKGFMYIKYGTSSIGYAASYVTYSGQKNELEN